MKSSINGLEFRQPKRKLCYCKICRKTIVRDRDYAIMFKEWWLKQTLVICPHCVMEMIELMRKTDCK